MKFFLDELRIISRFVWPIAFLVGSGVLFLLLLVGVPNDSNLNQWPLAGKLLLAVWVGLFSFAGVLLLGYINADARRRGMRPLMWTLLAIFIINGIGVILYFVLRDPLMISCSSCGHRARSSFVFCPQCGGELSPSCPACKRAVESDWIRCAYCGTELHP
jgi:predicted RNA-binding Zn-ribbon protein involved in translation (DUF1610 family)